MSIKTVMDTLATLRFEGDVWSVPEGTVVFPGRDAAPGDGTVAAGPMGGNASPGLACLSDARRFQGRASRRRGRGPVALRVWCQARAWPPGGHAGRAGGLPCRLHGDEPRRGRTPPGHPRERDDGALMGPVFRHGKRGVRGLRTGLPGKHDPAGRHLRHPEGVRHAAAIEPPVRAIRIDSGDLAHEARQARTILDQLGRSSVKIIASGDLDEYKIAELVGSGAPVDGFGVGTELITSRDAPALAMVYKLVELEGQGKFKLSPGKRTYPMAKQVFRRRDQNSRFCGDHVTQAEETAEGEPLLIPILRSGRLVTELPTLEGIRVRCRDQLAALPERLLGSGRSARLSDHVQRGARSPRAAAHESVMCRADSLGLRWRKRVRALCAGELTR